MNLSVIIPTLNEAANIRACLTALQSVRGHVCEIIVVDGGSTDTTIQLAEPLADVILKSKKGRAQQMNAGAAVAQGVVLLFLHADTLIEFDLEKVLKSINSERAWGRFDVRLSGGHFLLRIIEFFMNMRSRLTAIATGDQAIFITRDLFQKVGGFPDIELMEDIELSSRLKKICRPVCLHQTVITSSRRWEQQGIIRTILKMWYLRYRYWLGVGPSVLVREYDQ